MDLTLVALRTLRAVAEHRSFTAAARATGYTQSAVSRQVAAAERELGTRLFDRVRGGVRLTRAGSDVLPHLIVALDALEAAERKSARPVPRKRPVRVGAFAAAGLALVPQAIAELRRTEPDIEVTTRDGTTPALVRAVRAGTLDFAVISARQPYRSPDQENPPLTGHVLIETALALAVPAGRYGHQNAVRAAEVVKESWIASPAADDEPRLGVWPGLPGRPQVRHWARDWAVKLALVASGAGVTTVPRMLIPALPDGVATARIEDVPDELRLVSLIHLPGTAGSTADDIVRAFRTVADDLARVAGGRPLRSDDRRPR